MISKHRFILYLLRQGYEPDKDKRVFIKGSYIVIIKAYTVKCIQKTKRCERVVYNAYRRNMYLEHNTDKLVVDGRVPSHWNFNLKKNGGCSF